MTSSPASLSQTGDHAALLAEAETIARAAVSDIAQGFVVQLFAQVEQEDLGAYTAQDMAAIAQSSWAFLQERQVGASKIRILPWQVKRGAATANVSILEILNDDMPFLVDSVLSELSDRTLTLNLVAHPVAAVLRDERGRMVALNGEGARRESFIHIHLDRALADNECSELIAAFELVLSDVRVCVQDWRKMMERVSGVIAELKYNPPPLAQDELNEAVAFLEWLIANNFTFLGVRDYAVGGENPVMVAVEDTGLGLLRDRNAHVLRRGHELVTATPEIIKFLKEPRPLIVMKSAVRSRVHRRVYMDYVGVKRYDAQGQLIGEFRIVGLFTSTAYTQSTRAIPYLRLKVANVTKRAGFKPDSHLGKSLANVLENYPRDELFQVDENTLYEFSTAIMQLDGRARVRVLPRRDEFNRFVSVMVFVPRERYDSEAREAIGRYLANIYKGHISAYYPFFPEGPNVRVHFIIGRRDGETPNPPRAELESAVESIVRSWTDGFAEVLRSEHDPERARDLMRRYRDAFSAGYRGIYAPDVAVRDLRIIEHLSEANPRGVDFYARENGGLGLKIWNYGKPIPLTERVPVLENMGFRVVDERTYDIAPSHDEPRILWLHDMTLERADGASEALPAELKTLLEACFLAVMGGSAENDGYNALVLSATLGWRDIALVRTLSRFLRQVRVPFSQDYMWATLRKHAAIARQVVALFYARFDPRAGEDMNARTRAQEAIVGAIEEALKAVESLDEDRILRRFMNAVQSALRTSYFQLDASGRPVPVIAIKFESHKLDALPAPRPLYEIFVYSPRVEGVHLRFGKVARGGLRWSDRPQDFRTEVLGLVKAQQVKNAVIVPVGAKGGFVPKRLPAGGSREAVQEEGVAAYKIFIQALLDITDNVNGQSIVLPQNVVRHDGDDPYLVVAADKGTATFSDTANGLAQAHHFWLDDAFASGGSAGYDHKKMGITARGAWESVKRHFREMDVDIGATPFTVAGVGDMSGDVFGNGLLRETTTKLVAAFDHRDIFIDPNPDSAASFAERQRLFNLPRSSWQDYDKSLISKGGGIYSRGQKQIELSPEAQAVLGLSRASLTPQELMQAILKAPVDLLFFGGIGTYIRATSESDLDAGDRANDPIRIVGGDLRCKVVGEGANLGMTQRGRIEAAQHGVRLNTDAIDNSAGVNTSDVEVNIKIATAMVMRESKLTRPDRDILLAEMTDEVAALVLRNNYQQTLALSLARRRGLDDLGFQQRLMQVLERRGLLDRPVEYLPDDMEINERRRRSQPLTRPELAVLLAYAKLTLYSDLIESPVPDDPYLAREIGRYFPARLAEKFPEALDQHRLRREIIATQLSNSIINRGGPSMIVRLADQTGASPAAIASAFAAVRDSYAMTAFNTDIDLLDNQLAGETQLSLYAAVQDLLLDRLVWFLRNVDLKSGLADIVSHYRDGIAAIDAALKDILPHDITQARDARAKALEQAKVPAELAWRVANLPILANAPDIILIASRVQRPLASVAATYFALSAYFQLSAIVNAARAIDVTDYFDRLALDRAIDSISDAERRITAQIAAGEMRGREAVESWALSQGGQVERVRESIHEIVTTGLTISKLSVAASLIGDLARG